MHLGMRRLAAMIVCSIPVLAGGCGTDIVITAPPARHDVTAAQLQTMMADGGPLTLVDVRSAGEYAAGHIPGSINVPSGGLTAWAATQGPHTRIVCICWAGVRSRAAADQLVALGFARVYNLLGGVSNWPGPLATN